MAGDITSEWTENPKESTKKVVRANKWIQQSFRMPDEHTKLSCILYSSNEQPKNKIKNSIYLQEHKKEFNF